MLKLIKYIYQDRSFQDNLWTIAGQIIISLTAFATTLILTRYLDKETFGEYRFILTLIPILIVFTLPKLTAAITTAVAQDIPVHLPAIVRAKIRWGLIASSVSLALSLYYFFQNNSVLGLALIVTAIFIPFFDTFLIYKSYLQGKQEFKTAAIYQSSTRLFAAIILISTIFLTQNILLILPIFFLSTILPQLFFYLRVLKKNKSWGQSDPSTLQYGKNLSFIAAFQASVAIADKILIWHFLGSEALAIYVVALLIPLEATRLLESLAHVSLPNFAQKEWSLFSVKKNLLKTILFLFIGLLIMALIYIYIIPYLFPILFPEYSAYIKLTQFGAILLLLVPINMIVAQVFIAARWKKDIIIVSAISLFVIYLSFLFFYPIFGLLGAMGAVILKEVVVFFLQAGLLFRSRT